MRAYKIINLLNTLSSNEMKEFHSWIESQTIKNSPVFTKVVNLLINLKLNPNSNDDKLKIYKNIFPEEVYNSQKLRLIFSRLTKMLLTFIGEDKAVKPVLILKHLRKHHLTKLFEHQIEVEIKNLDNNFKFNEDFLSIKYQFLDENYRFKTTKKRHGEFNMELLEDNINLEFYFKKLKHACRILSIKSISKSSLNIKFLEGILKELAILDLNDYPTVELYYYNYLIQTENEDEVHFYKFQELLIRYNAQLNIDDLKDHFITAINYCIRKSNNGNDKFLEFLFEFYKKGIELSVFLEQEKLSRFTYRNIIEVGLKNKDFAFVADFIENFTTRLEFKYQESFSNLEKGRLASKLLDFDMAWKYLAPLTFDDAIVDLATRVEKIKILYETRNYELMDYHLANFDSFINRKKNIGYQSEYYQHFSKYCKRLIKIEASQKRKIKLTIDEINSSSKLVEKKWLLEKYENEYSTSKWN
jgi:hypothetical protein